MIVPMLVDGKMIANEWREKLKMSVLKLGVSPVLAIVVAGNDPVIESFVRIKKKFGESVGIKIEEYRFPETVSGEKLIFEIGMIAGREDVDGIIVQLPLPLSVDVDAVLNAVPVEKDVDVLSRHAVALFARGEAMIFPPVASAVQEILERHNVHVENKEVLVLGFGRLVGKPVSILLRHNHAHVTVIDRPVTDLAMHVRESDIVVSGVGTPRLITPQMLKQEAVLIDAGTSEQGGRIVGDADPACAEHAALFTPVPGGVGPLAIAMLFRNLVILARTHHEKK